MALTNVKKSLAKCLLLAEYPFMHDSFTA